MIICDLCGKQIGNPIKKELPYEITETTTRTKTFDLCQICHIEIDLHIKKAMSDFVNERRKQEGAK